jgi:hypothetical protein
MGLLTIPLTKPDLIGEIDFLGGETDFLGQNYNHRTMVEIPSGALAREKT